MAESTLQATTKNIVILGGSYAGVSTAHYLLKHAIPKLPDSSTYQVILVSASSEVLCRPACPRAMISDDLLPQDKLFVSIPEVFKKHPVNNFQFEHARAEHVDHTKRTVSIRYEKDEEDEKIIPFHALVIATGSSTPSPLLSLNKDSAEIRAQWALFRDAMKKAKSIVIAGGGPAGIETAGELGEYLNGQPGWFAGKLENPKVEITVVTSASQILPLLRSSIAEKAEGYLARVGVTVVKGTKVTGVSPAESGTDLALPTKATVSLSDGTELDADIYIPAVGMTPNTSFLDKTLLMSDGRVETNHSTLRVDKAGDRIYAVGDVGSYARPAVHSILNAVPVVCANIKRDLLLASGEREASLGAERSFKEDTRETQMVPIGRSKGVGAAMGYRLPSFLVWLIKGRDYWLWTTGDLWSGKQWEKES
ncbi:Oxidoreductase [Penicillium longicatenatum]|uniref:Oxidoreductase n=1 Tax=Penicillium longicatenatum TaxID=1561947 RepID=UPI002546E2F5|nr:Oxidoreductase [Penicillium longicatenatum]KAJ5657506.1 Oxidoreductase [Penicillium longicatenatum]